MDKYLYHHGIKGQKWGIRRYQNLDGTLTEAGKERYADHIEDVKPRKLERQFARSNSIFNSYKNKKIAIKEYNKERKQFLKSTKKVKDPEKLIELAKDFTNKQNSKYAGAALKDMGYNDTEKGREYLLSRPWYKGMSWRDLYD